MNRTIERLGLVFFMAVTLAGCSTSGTKPAATYDQINQELARAAAERKTSADAMEKALLPPLQVELPKAASEAEQRFDLAVVGAPAGQVFMALVTGTRYSMLLPPELSGNITVNLKDVTLKEALDTIRELYGYEYKVQGNRIFVQPNTLQTRLFQINYLASRRQGNSDLRVTSSSVSAALAGSTLTGGTGTTPTAQPTQAGAASAGGGTRSSDTSRVSMNSDADFWRDLTTALTAIVGTADGRSVIVNSMSGVVVVRALPSDMRNVEGYLRATQLVVERQVMLEAKILEVALSEDYQAGVNWSAFKSGQNSFSQIGVVAPGTTLNAASGPPSAAGAIGNTTVAVLPGQFGGVTASSIGKGIVGLAFQTSNFAALLNFLESQGNVSVLSSPRIATLNNQKAVLKVGTDELYVTNVSTSSTTSGTSTVTTPTLTLQPYFSGISLDVTPQIDEDGNIILHVHPAVSTVQEKEKIIDLGASIGQFKLPLAASSINETDSIVRVKDGNIVAIGGLMRQRQEQSRNQLPGTGNSSILSTLFGQRSNSLVKNELVILIKPTVIQSDRTWVDDLQQVQGRIQALEPQRAVPQQ